MKPKLASGTRDFGPRELTKRKHITHEIQKVFEKNAYVPLETPAFEQLDTLTGKYGEEGDKLIFKILNNGLNEKSEEKKQRTAEAFDDLIREGKNSNLLTERALKYDLTIPFARYVAMNSHDLVFPFRRYQMQPVWRADRPQKGRYREFWQCDADVVGVQSLAYDAELICIYDDVFEALRLPTIRICVNHRMLLAGIADYLIISDRWLAFTVILDKLDKIGWQAVKLQLQNLGADPQRLEKVEPILNAQAPSKDVLDYLETLASNENLDKGINELKSLMSIVRSYKPNTHCEIYIDTSLARGLDYYTGMIVEVRSTHASGSLGGGGRYDELTAIFGLRDMPGVGISFGLDRIYNMIEDLNLFPSDVLKSPDLYLYVETDNRSVFHYISRWKEEGVSLEVVFDKTKIDKVYKKAEKKNIRHVAILTEQDATNKSMTIKNINNGEKEIVSFGEVSNFLLRTQN